MDFIGTDATGNLVYMNQHGFVAGFKATPLTAENKVTSWLLPEKYSDEYGPINPFPEE
jgi:hypothetical protein